MTNLSTFADAYTAFTNSGFFEMLDADETDHIEAIARNVYRAAPGNGYVSDDDASILFQSAIIEICGWSKSDF